MKAFKVAAVAVVALVMLAGAYFAPRALAHSVSDDSGQSVSYVDSDSLTAKLARNDHSVATKAGSFVNSADISNANIVSAHQIAVK